MRKLTHKQMASELHNQFWFNWENQKRCVYDIASTLYVNNKLEAPASDCIRSAHDFVETFRKEVIDKETKIYYNKG